MQKRAAIYTRVSTADQHPETQLYDLREMAKVRGYEIVHEYSDVTAVRLKVEQNQLVGVLEGI